MHVHHRSLAAGQADVVAGWQLAAAGWTRRVIRHRVNVHGWRVVHPGVYALTNAPLTRRQLWFAATLTAPGSFLSHASAGACLGFRPFEGMVEMVTRAGSGGRRRHGGVLVFHSTTLDGDTTHHEGIPITTAARTMIDLAASLNAKATKRMFREALRLKSTTIPDLAATLSRHRGRRGTALLDRLATRYSSLPYGRTRSDAEALALELLHDAGLEPPRVNTRIAGKEADLSWPGPRLIVEIDGPQFHRFRDEDARTQLRWERAGYTVRRLPSDAVYDGPAELLALVRGGGPG